MSFDLWSSFPLCSVCKGTKFQSNLQGIQFKISNFARTTPSLVWLWWGNVYAFPIVRWSCQDIWHGKAKLLLNNVMSYGANREILHRFYINW